MPRCISRVRRAVPTRQCVATRAATALHLVEHVRHCLPQERQAAGQRESRRGQKARRSTSGSPWSWMGTARSFASGSPKERRSNRLSKLGFGEELGEGPGGELRGNQKTLHQKRFVLARTSRRGSLRPCQSIANASRLCETTVDRRVDVVQARQIFVQAGPRRRRRRHPCRSPASRLRRAPKYERRWCRRTLRRRPENRDVRSGNSGMAVQSTATRAETSASSGGTTPKMTVWVLPVFSAVMKYVSPNTSSG